MHRIASVCNQADLFVQTSTASDHMHPWERTKQIAQFYGPQTKILERVTKDEMRRLDRRFNG